MTKNEKTAVFENFAQQAARRMEEKKKHRKERLKIKSMGDTEIEIRGLSDKELNECFEFSEEPLEVDRYTIYYASQTLQEAAKILISNGTLKQGQEYKIAETFNSVERNFIVKRILELSGASGDAGIEVVSEVEEIKNS